MVTIKSNRKSVRVINKRVPDKKYPQLGYKLIATEVNNLPLKLKDKQLIISRECLRGILIIQKNILKETPGFLTWWIAQNKPWLGKNIRGVLFENLKIKYPKFYYFIETLPAETRRGFFNSIKLYWDRDDLWAVGEQVRDHNNNIIAAWQLIRTVDEESIYERY